MFCLIRNFFGNPVKMAPKDHRQRDSSIFRLYHMAVGIFACEPLSRLVKGGGLRQIDLVQQDYIGSVELVFNCTGKITVLALISNGFRIGDNDDTVNCVADN